MSEVVNVWGGECLGGECLGGERLTIITANNQEICKTVKTQDIPNRYYL